MKALEERKLVLGVTQMNDFSFTVNPDAVASVHDDGIVILDTGNGHMYASNGTGARIWRGIEQELSVEAIAEGISSHYEVSQTMARQQVVSFLAQLEQHTLIRRERTL